MKLTSILIIVMLPLMIGCAETPKSAPAKQRLILTPPHLVTAEDTCCRIRFNSEKKKDEKTLAMEKVSDRWNRNLYLSGGYQSLEEYAADYESNP